MDWKNYFKNKRITVMGLGLLGRALNDVKFLHKMGADLTVTDLKNEIDLAPSLKKLASLSHIKYVLGKHREEDFKNADMVLKGAGVPLDSPYIKIAKENGVQVEMDESLFLKLAPEIISIGVTGTRGKSTTTQLIYEILKSAGKRVFLGGNVKDVATLPLLLKVKPGDYVVMELSSWQLQGFAESRQSPHIAVFTNIFEDHLNYYDGNMDRYIKDKAAIFDYQSLDDFKVFGKKVAEMLKRKYKIVGHVYEIDQTSLPLDMVLKLKGEHNRFNAALAFTVGNILGLQEGKLKKAIQNFKGVEGRLELIKRYKGVDIYNDTTSTTPEACIAGIRALANMDNKNIILIMGGADKNLKMAELLDVVQSKCKAVVLLPGSGTSKLKESLRFKTIASIVSDVFDLKSAISVAVKKSTKNDVILFSPAFASFGKPPGGFKNEFDRGEKFVREVKLLK